LSIYAGKCLGHVVAPVVANVSPFIREVDMGHSTRTRPNKVTSSDPSCPDRTSVSTASTAPSMSKNLHTPVRPTSSAKSPSAGGEMISRDTASHQEGIKENCPFSGTEDEIRDGTAARRWPPANGVRLILRLIALSTLISNLQAIEEVQRTR